MAAHPGGARIDGAGDRDGDGFVEYHRATDKGLLNQGWKDSYDAIFHADGTLAEGPIALVEVQAYVYAAKRSIARAAEMLGEHDHAARLRREAQGLAERFDEAFWCEALGCYVAASTARSANARWSAPMPATPCSAALPAPIAPR